MKKYRLQFFLKVLIVAILLVVVDFIAGYVLDRLYSTSKSGVSYQEYYSFYKANQEILIFGSSRAAFHYIPDIFENELRLSTYNLGREGVGIYYHHALLIATIERYKPKIIIIDLDFRDFYDRGGSFGKDVFKELAPFYKRINNEFDSTLVRNWYDKFLYESNLFKYNKKIFNIISSNFIKGRDNFNGYRPLFGELQKYSQKEVLEISKVDSNLLITLENFIQITQENNIKLIFVVSPSLRNLPESIFKPMGLISEKYNIPVLNYLKDQRFLINTKLFKDEEHLNDAGAKVFSEILANEINITLNSQGVTSDK